MRYRRVPNLGDDYVQVLERVHTLERIVQAIGFSPDFPYTLSVNDGTRNRVLIGLIGGQYGIKIVNNAGVEIVFADGHISATGITTGTLDASVVNVTNLNASNIVTGTLSATKIVGGTLNCSLMTVTNLTASAINTGSMSGDRITARTLQADRLVTNSISSDELETTDLITQSAQIRNGIITNAHITQLDAGKVNTGTLNAITINLNGVNLNGYLGIGGANQPTRIQGANSTYADTGYYTWTGGSKIWVDTNGYMGMKATGERFYFYTGSVLYALFQRGSQAGFYAGISCQGVFNVGAVGDHYDTRLTGKLYMYETGTSQAIDSDSDDMRYSATDNHEFYHNGDIKAIIDENIWTDGDLQANGSKPFIVPHPDGSNRLLRYTAQESPDVSLRYRGIAKIVGGRCEIDIPKHFTLITEPEGLVTVNLTAMQKNQNLFVSSIYKNEYILIEGEDGRFMFEVVAIRKGYLNYAVELDGKSSNAKDKALFDKMKSTPQKNIDFKAREASEKIKKGKNVRTKAIV